MKIQSVKIDDISQDPANVRKHSERNLSAIVASLRKFGQQKPIVVNADGIILAGNGTYEAAKRLGWDKIDVVWSNLKGSDATGFAIADNRTAELAEWDETALAETLRALQSEDFDVEAAGWQEDEIDGLLEKLGADLAGSDPKEIVEDEVPEPPVDPITKPGDLWILGEHRLLCGDSTKAEDVARLMGGAKEAMLMATDPPYGVDFAGAKYNPKAKQWDAIANDELQGADLESFIVKMLNAWIPYVSKQAGFYFWTAAMQEGAAAAAAVRSVGLHIQSQIIWNKNCLVLGQADYHWKHENCWYAFWKGQKHRWFGERDKTTVWEVKKVNNSDYVHPMQKPVELYAIPMRHHTHEGEVVVEPFGGSGSQFIAAEQLGRKCYGMEISPQYCDVIVKRWENLTGMVAVREKS